jgi:hypothetical protein
MSPPSPTSTPEFDPQRVLAPIALALLAGCPVGIACGVVLFGFLSRESRLEPLAFDSARWIAEPHSSHASLERSERRAMAPDVIERLLVPGTTRAQAREWLGPSNRWTVFDTRPWFSKEDESFWLGCAEVGDEWLVLDFDAHDRLVNASIVNCFYSEQ